MVSFTPLPSLNFLAAQVTLQPKQLNVALRVHNTGAAGKLARAPAPPQTRRANFRITDPEFLVSHTRTPIRRSIDTPHAL